MDNPANPGDAIRVVIVSGLSGSGKSSAIRALEDRGFFCVDNLPVLLFDKVVSICEQTRGEIVRVAVGMDARGGSFLQHYEDELKRIRARGHSPEILYLEASNEVLIQRFSETRRKHPLADEGVLEGAISQERQLLRYIREQATHIVDTSSLTPHELKRIVQQVLLQSSERSIVVSVQTFGFKFGLPVEADFVFDVRFLKNPYFETDLRPLTGLEAPVKSFVMCQKNAVEFLRRVHDLITFVEPLAIEEGRSRLTVAVGCTGGRHRSVVIAEELGGRLRSSSRPVSVWHRDINRV